MFVVPITFPANHRSKNSAQGRVLTPQQSEGAPQGSQHPLGCCDQSLARSAKPKPSLHAVHSISAFSNPSLSAIQSAVETETQRSYRRIARKPANCGLSAFWDSVIVDWGRPQLGRIMPRVSNGDFASQEWEFSGIRSACAGRPMRPVSRASALPVLGFRERNQYQLHLQFC